jgi:hypothetical protein
MGEHWIPFHSLSRLFMFYLLESENFDLKK